MAGPSRICIICSEPFELEPQKPGFANRCPKCSSPKPLDPKVARQADRERRRQTIEAAIRGEAKAKQLAVAHGEEAAAAECERRIQILRLMKSKLELLLPRERKET